MARAGTRATTFHGLGLGLGLRAGSIGARKPNVLRFVPANRKRVASGKHTGSNDHPVWHELEHARLRSEALGKDPADWRMNPTSNRQPPTANRQLPTANRHLTPQTGRNPDPETPAHAFRMETQLREGGRQISNAVRPGNPQSRMLVQNRSA